MVSVSEVNVVLVSAAVDDVESFIGDVVNLCDVTVDDVVSAFVEDALLE